LQVADLIKKRDASISGVILLDDATVSRYADAPDRSYSLIIFFNAKGKESPQMKMGEMYSNFQLAAQHVKKVGREPEHKSAANKVFFVAMEFAHSKQAFARLGVKAIPWIIHLGPKLQSGYRVASHAS
jgi:OST3 / OST6 family, transporter family